VLRGQRRLRIGVLRGQRQRLRIGVLRGQRQRLQIGVLRGQRNISLWPHSLLSRPEPLLFLPSSSSIVFTSEAEWTQFQTHLSENLVVPGIEPGTAGSVARTSDHQTTEVVTHRP
jgi:hypothetical protein